jgi:hypothetical protein
MVKRAAYVFQSCRPHGTNFRYFSYVDRCTRFLLHDSNQNSRSLLACSPANKTRGSAHSHKIQKNRKYEHKQTTTMTQQLISGNMDEATTAEPGIDTIEVTDTGIIFITASRPAEIDYTYDEGNPHTKRQLCGASIAGCMAGWLCGGPLVGAAAAGAASLAVSSRSQTGEVARASGEAVAKVGDRIKKFDQKHHLVDKTTDGATKGFDWSAKRIKPHESFHSAAA